MFDEKGKKEVDNFMSYLDKFEEDRKKRIEIIKRIDKLLNTNTLKSEQNGGYPRYEV